MYRIDLYICSELETMILSIFKYILFDKHIWVHIYVCIYSVPMCVYIYIPYILMLNLLSTAAGDIYYKIKRQISEKTSLWSLEFFAQIHFFSSHSSPEFQAHNGQ